MPELRVSKIANGSVIDHIPAGMGIEVLRILNIDESFDKTLSLAMNVGSSRMGKKDIVKAEGRELVEEEVESVSVIAPSATLNIIKDYDVVEKRRLELPDRIEGVIDCPNPQCVTNTEEPVRALFDVLGEDPVELKCGYCEREFTTSDLEI